MKAAFTIIAPDTDSGKTYSTATILRNYLSKNINAMACKPIQTGSADGKSEDLDYILHTAGLSVTDEVYKKLVPITLRTPASPLLASIIEKKTINLEEITKHIKELSNDYDILLVETAGGILSPITETGTNIDLARELDFPVIICVPNRVGAISLALMTVKIARDYGLSIEGVVFSETISPKNETDILINKDNVETFRRITGVKILADIKFGGSHDK